MDKFHEWLQLNYNSKRTVESYFQQVNAFGQFCNYEFTQDNLNKYLLKWKEENKTNATFNSFKIAMISYCKYTNTKFDFPKWLKTRRKEIKFYLTEDMLNEVLKYFHGEEDLILRLMFYTGARPSEILNLYVEHINFEKKDIIFYNAKGNKDRVVPFINNKLYLDIKQYCLNKSRLVFNINYYDINSNIKKIKKILSLPDTEIIEPRTMRISFAKYCLSIGMDISYLKKLMGHSDIKITELYAEPDEKMIKEFCERIRKNENKKT